MKWPSVLRPAVTFRMFEKGLSSVGCFAIEWSAGVPQSPVSCYSAARSAVIIAPKCPEHQNDPVEVFTVQALSGMWSNLLASRGYIFDVVLFPSLFDRVYLWLSAQPQVTLKESRRRRKALWRMKCDSAVCQTSFSSRRGQVKEADEGIWQRNGTEPELAQLHVHMSSPLAPSLPLSLCLSPTLSPSLFLLLLPPPLRVTVFLFSFFFVDCSTAVVIVTVMQTAWTGCLSAWICQVCVCLIKRQSALGLERKCLENYVMSSSSSFFFKKRGKS